jgi:hypothetical protein
MDSRTAPEILRRRSGKFPHSVVKGSSDQVSQVQCGIGTFGRNGSETFGLGGES